MPSLPRFGGRAALAVSLAFLLLGALYTAPLVAHLPDSLPFAAVPPPGQENLWRVQGDYLQFYYYLWVSRAQLRDGRTILRDPYQFAVDGPRLNLPNTFLPVALLYLPLSVLGPRLAYNLLILLSFPLAGLSATLLVHRYGLGRGPAIVAGVVFACAPYRVGALLGGHPAGIAYLLIPLALWGLEGVLAGSVAGGVWTGVALASLPLLEPHFFYFTALALPPYLLARVGLAGWTRGSLRVGAAAWAAALVVAMAAGWGALALLEKRGWQAPQGARLAIAVVVGLVVLAAWQCGAGWLAVAGGALPGREAARRSLLACLPWTATAAAGVRAGRWLVPLGIATPAVIHVAWLIRARRGQDRVPLMPWALAATGAAAGAGYLVLFQHLVLTHSVVASGRPLHEVGLFSALPSDLLVRVNPAANRAIYVGGVTLLLTLVGFTWLCLRRPDPRRRILFAFGPLLVVAVVLSLGPRVRGLPLFEAAFYGVPFWKFVRQPAKFQVLAGLALGVLAAIGVEALATQVRQRWHRAALVAGIALLIAAEYHSWRPIGMSRLPTADNVYEAIRALGPRALYVPLWPGDSSLSAVYLYTTTLTRVPMLNGYSAFADRAYVAEVYRTLEAVNLGVVREAEYAALRRYGVRQLILDRDVFPLKVSGFGSAFTLANLRASPYLDLTWAPADGRPLWVFRVRERPRDTAVPLAPRSPLGIYREAESLPHETGRVVEDPDASNGRVLFARSDRDPPGFLTFGPYRMLPAGPFRAVFWLRGAGAGVELQVTSSEGRRMVGRRELRLDGGGFRGVAVPFTLEEPTAVEYRVRWDGTGWLAVDAVLVTFADVPDPAPAFEVKLLAHGLLERDDPAASGGRAGYADPARILSELTWEGPFRVYPAGHYRLWVRLKVDQLTAAPLAWCAARAASAGPVFGGRELVGTEVPVAGRYVELAVPFTLPRAAVLELPCLYRRTVGVWFDRVRVEGPLASPS